MSEPARLTPDDQVPAEPPEPTPEPPAAPTREELRQKVRAALTEGRISVEDVLADIYASQYNFERTVTGIMEAFSTSSLGRRMMKKAEKQYAKEEALDGTLEP